MLLSIENLTFGWHQDTIFENIRCQLRNSEIIQLTGENGAGKTTLLQLISGMIPHFSRGEILQGNIFINGRSILRKSPKYFFPVIAFIPGVNIDFFLLSDLLSQEIEFCRSILKIETTRVEERLHQFSNFFSNIAGLIDIPFKRMGFYQKVLSLTLIFYLQNARLYLFDEILNILTGIDVERWYSFFEWLGMSGCSIIFVDHLQRANKYPQWLLRDKKLITR